MSSTLYVHMAKPFLSSNFKKSMKIAALVNKILSLIGESGGTAAAPACTQCEVSHTGVGIVWLSSARVVCFDNDAAKLANLHPCWCVAPTRGSRSSRTFVSNESLCVGARVHGLAAGHQTINY